MPAINILASYAWVQGNYFFQFSSSSWHYDCEKYLEVCFLLWIQACWWIAAFSWLITVAFCTVQGWREGCSPGPGLWCKEQGGAFGCLGRSWERRGHSVMEWLLSPLLSCLPWHECLSSSTLKGTLLAKGEWDILATDPRIRVKGNKGADKREHNYGWKTKRNLVSKQLFWWEGERGSVLTGYNWDQDIFPGKLCPYRIRSPMMKSWGLGLIGRLVAFIWWWLAGAGRHRKWHDDSHSPTPVKNKLDNQGNTGIVNILTYVAERVCCIGTFTVCKRVFMHTTVTLSF